MSRDLATLYEVQQIDTEIAHIKDALAGLDTGAALQAGISAAEAELVALRGRLRDTEKESLAQELELKTIEEKRKKFEAQLYGGTVRNPKQLDDLNNEVAMLKREIGKIEDRMLELMDSLEQARAEIKNREARLVEMRQRLEEVQQQFATVSGRLRGELSAHEGRRKELTAQVPVQLLKRYEQLRARQANLGLVKVTGTTCPGCRIALPSETLKGLKASRGVLTCENCGRLLFWDESES